MAEQESVSRRKSLSLSNWAIKSVSCGNSQEEKSEHIKTEWHLIQVQSWMWKSPEPIKDQNFETKDPNSHKKPMQVREGGTLA